MQKILAKLERKFGRYAPANLTYYLVGTQALVFVFELIKPGFSSMLVMNSGLVLQGQIWRLFTWLFIPPTYSPLFILFALIWLYSMGIQMESRWGAFVYLLYWLLGWLGSTAIAFAFGLSLDNSYLLLSLFLAFATLWPNYQLLFFFVIPMPVKWLAWVDAFLILAMVAVLPGLQKLVPLMAFSNYLLFFGPHLFALLKNFKRNASQAKVKQRLNHQQKEVEESKRVCSLCGVNSDDPTQEFRMCACEKCIEPKEFCLKHAWEH